MSGINQDSAVERRVSFDSLFYVRALPNEYLVEIGAGETRIMLGGTVFSPFNRFVKIPASAEITGFELECSTSNYIGIIVSGYVAWRIDPANAERAVKCLDLYDADRPLAKTAALIRDMARDAVRRTIAGIKVDQILTSSDNLKAGIEEILRDVAKWGLLVDSIGINRIFIKSEKVFDDLQKEDRNRLKLISDLSTQEMESKTAQNALEHEKALAVSQSDLKEIRLREEIRQQKLTEEALMNKARMTKEREKEEIRLAAEIEEARYAYQKDRVVHDKDLQENTCQMELRKLDVEERRRQIAGAVTDREMTELVMSKAEAIAAPFKDSRLTVLGGNDDVSRSLLAPLTAVMELVRSLWKGTNTGPAKSSG
jgi:hypothetical protein